MITRGTPSLPALRILFRRNTHPLRREGSSPSSTGSFAHEEDAHVPGTPCLSDHQPGRTNLDGNFEAYTPNLKAEDASEEESLDPGSGSNLDAELGGDSDTASNYDSEDLDRAPKLSSLILLDDKHSRAPTQVTSPWKGARSAAYAERAAPTADATRTEKDTTAIRATTLQ
jgi:hypothetical protein